MGRPYIPSSRTAYVQLVIDPRSLQIKGFRITSDQELAVAPGRPLYSRVSGKYVAPTFEGAVRAARAGFLRNHALARRLPEL